MKNKNIKHYLFLIMTLLVLLFLGQLIYLNVLPIKYLVPIILAFLLLIFISFRQISKNNNKKSLAFKLILLLLVLALSLANIYIYKTGLFLDNVSDSNQMLDTVSVIVKNDHPAKDMNDLLDKKIGIEDDREPVIEETIKHINKEFDANLKISEFNSYGGLVNHLYSDDLDAIMINEAFRNFILESYPEFDDETRVIYQHEMESQLKQPESDKKVSKDAFNVLISGIDIYGPINSKSRSDVNILASVNPSNKNIVLTAVPRDYFLPMPCQNGASDKLTHSGIYGVDCTMDTLANAFNIEVDHFVRVNFSSFTQVIDLLGGVNVYVDEAFTANGYSFSVGENYMDGAKALVFVRDRYHQSGGDRDRGKNQMKVITAVINKAMSPQIIKNYMSILNSLEGSFQTSLSSKEITSLVQLQLNDMSRWNIIEQRVDGYNAFAYSPALGFDVYVMHPDQSTIVEALAKIDAAMTE